MINQSEDYGRTQVGALVGQGLGGATIGFQAMDEMALKQYNLQAVKMKCITERSAMSLQHSKMIYCKTQQRCLISSVGDDQTSSNTERGLEAHKEKTCYLVCGSKELKARTNKQLKVMHVMIGKFLP